MPAFLQNGPKMAPFIVRFITSLNINRFSKFFHSQNQKTICNKTVTIDPTTPKVCHYATSWNVRWRTQAGHWPVAWSTLIEPGMWPPNNPDLNPVNYAVWDALQQMAYQCWRFTTDNQLKKTIVFDCGKVPQHLVNCTTG